MISNTETMNSNDLLCFMGEPNSQARIIEEFNSIAPMQRDEIRHKPDQDKDSNINGCFSMVSYFYRRAKPNNNEVVLDASFVDSYDTERKFLCTRNPRAEEFNTFWNLVWENEVRIIVMTCQLTNGSYQYWSSKEGYTLSCKKFKIMTQKIAIRSHYSLTLLELTKTDRKSKNFRIIYHYHYTAWPREKFSHQPKAFVKFYQHISVLYAELGKRAAGKELPPILVHSLDGTGSSEVFCVFDIFIMAFKITGLISLPNALKKFRQGKEGFIDRADLYVLCYQLAVTYINESSLSEF